MFELESVPDTISPFGTLFTLAIAQQLRDYAPVAMLVINHRAKNMFTVISAIARQIGASNLDRAKFEQAFDERLRSFASSYELLALDASFLKEL